nr:hypothetical protein [Verrucomicrobiales bacterium]
MSTEPNQIAFSPEEKARIRKAILVNILKKIEQGGTPTAQEQRVLDEATAAPMETSLAPGQSAPAAPAEAGREPSRAEWAAFYSVSEKQLSRWRTDGVAKNLPPPLGMPEQMCDWWPQIYTNRVSAKIIAAAERVRRGEVPPGGPVAAPTSAAGPKPSGQVELSLGFLKDKRGFHYQDSVALAELNLRACAEILRQALEKNDYTLLRTAQQQYLDANEAYRKTKLSAQKIGEQEGAFLSRETVRSELAQIHSAIPKRLRLVLAEKLSVFHRQQTSPTIDQIRGIVEAAVDEACISLRDSDFTDPSSDLQLPASCPPQPSIANSTDRSPSPKSGSIRET